MTIEVKTDMKRVASKMSLLPNQQKITGPIQKMRNVVDDFTRIL